MGKYADSEEWADVVPIEQDDGGPNPLAAIAYTESYSEAMAYLRAVMAKDEKSERVLELTEDIIGMNPAHYTVWYVPASELKLLADERSYRGRRLYRASVLFSLDADLAEELQWLDDVSLKHLKNYQIW